MLKIAKSVEYALFALKYMSEKGSNSCSSVSEISEYQNIPYDLLAKIMQKLAKANIISSYQGIKGGYILKATPEMISLNKLITILDKKIQFTDCMVEKPTTADCQRVLNCCIRNPMLKIQNRLNELFESTTVQDLIQ
ncbi:Rrf2 family transcriptional regulator [Melioribacteraceae bacterium 4301-Me]|uniref:RrF2 family transcriptional regulator n=1 Tax=Pyranulibacter aquaticus TaxID=3163344 RepID=UPI0035991874